MSNLALSKIISPALRLGYLIGPRNDLVKLLIQRTNDIGFSASLFNQEIASFVLDHYASEIVSNTNSIYKKKAQSVKTLIKDYLGEFIDVCSGGRGGFYFYLTFNDIETHEKSLFFESLNGTSNYSGVVSVNKNKRPIVTYIPGEHCVHRLGELVAIGKKQLRISYGYESLLKIESGFKLMRDAIDS